MRLASPSITVVHSHASRLVDRRRCRRARCCQSAALWRMTQGAAAVAEHDAPSLVAEIGRYVPATAVPALSGFVSVTALTRILPPQQFASIALVGAAVAI